jgi:hypothetical protein
MVITNIFRDILPNRRRDPACGSRAEPSFSAPVRSLWGLPETALHSQYIAFVI